MSLSQPKLTPSQLEKIKLAAEKVITHPFNHVKETPLNKLNVIERNKLETSFNSARYILSELTTPSVIHSLVESVQNPGRKDQFDLNKELTENN